MNNTNPGCMSCKHWDANNMMLCKAYPAGIPWPILSGEVGHTQALPGDNGIQFEPVKEPANAQR